MASSSPYVGTINEFFGRLVRDRVATTGARSGNVVVRYTPVFGVNRDFGRLTYPAEAEATPIASLYSVSALHFAAAVRIHHRSVLAWASSVRQPSADGRFWQEFVTIDLGALPEGPALAVALRETKAVEPKYIKVVVR
jgi:hypothetical protein